MSYLPPTHTPIVPPVLGTFSESNSGDFVLAQARLKKESETENRNQPGRPTGRPLPPVLGMILIHAQSSWTAWMEVTRGLNWQAWEYESINANLNEARKELQPLRG